MIRPDTHAVGAVEETSTVQSASEQGGDGPAAVKVYHSLRVPIVDGEIAPGARITIDEVARRLGVSQTPVREALQRLEADGLVVYTPSRGYRTTAVLDLPALRAVFEFRLLVEPWAARTAAGDALANPSVALEKELDAFEEAVARHQDLRQDMLGHDTRFHDLILAAAGNEVVRQAFTQTHCHLHVFRLYPVDTDGSFTVREHRSIAQAIKAGDATAAEHAMAQHIRSSFQRSARAFDGPPSPAARTGLDRP
jgi:DNA-binding GntR family transcriptional regulator